jgi:hypothetical protein
MQALLSAIWLVAPDLTPRLCWLEPYQIKGTDSIHSQGELRSSGGTIRARWILYICIRINVRGLRTESSSPPLIHVYWSVVLDTNGGAPG